MAVVIDVLVHTSGVTSVWQASQGRTCNSAVYVSCFTELLHSFIHSFIHNFHNILRRHCRGLRIFYSHVKEIKLRTGSWNSWVSIHPQLQYSWQPMNQLYHTLVLTPQSVPLSVAGHWPH